VKRILLLFSLILMTSSQVLAAETVELMSLKDAINLALKNNNRIKAAGFGAEAAERSVAIATSGYYPTIGFEEALVASNAPTQTFMMKLDEGRFTQNDFLINNLNHPGTWHDFKTVLTAQLPLYTPSLAPAREMAVKTSLKGQQNLEATREEIAFQVFQLYLDVQRSRAQLQSADQAVIEAKENMRLASVRNMEGVGLRSDVLRARTHLLTVEQQQISARNNLTLAGMQLALVAGLPEGSRIEISEAVAPVALAFTPAELTGSALEERSDLKLSRTELERNDASVNLARSAWLPSLAAFGSYQLNAKDTPFGSDNDSWVAGLSLKWNVFDGFRRSNEQARAAAERSAAAEQLEGKIREARYQVQESILRREETGKRLDVARSALQDADETVRLLTRRFENSLATMVELLDAQSALNQVRANLVDMEANYALSGGRVFHAAGIFLKEIIK